MLNSRAWHEPRLCNRWMDVTRTASTSHQHHSTPHPKPPPLLSYSHSLTLHHSPLILSLSCAIISYDLLVCTSDVTLPSGVGVGRKGVLNFTLGFQRCNIPSNALSHGYYHSPERVLLSSEILLFCSKLSSRLTACSKKVCKVLNQYTQNTVNQLQRVK